MINILSLYCSFPLFIPTLSTIRIDLNQEDVASDIGDGIGIRALSDLVQVGVELVITSKVRAEPKLHDLSTFNRCGQPFDNIQRAQSSPGMSTTIPLVV